MGTYNKQVDTYQDTFELVVAISKASISFAREYKYTFGERIIDYSLDTITEVYLAKDEFKPEKKVDHINNALKSLALLDILWKTCGEIPNLSTNVYTEQMENIAKIKKHLKAWRDYCEKNTNKEYQIIFIFSRLSMDKFMLFKNLYLAYLEARRHKRHTHSQMVFESDLSENLLELRDDIYNGTYKISPSIYFIQMNPIQREVFAGNFRDRIVHHLIYNCISPFREKQFIYDSYSCRKGKGTMKGIERISKFMRSCSNNYKEEGWILKLDIQGYFMSINKDILWYKIVDALNSWNKFPISCNDNLFPLGRGLVMGEFPEYLKTIIKDIVYNNPTSDGIFKGKPADYDGLPLTKSLFYTKPGCGLPIGNLTSQLFSNIYLNDFDHFMKEELKLKYYGRYVDDFVVIHKDKEYLKSIIPLIKNFLDKELALTLHPKKIYLQPIKHGVQFLGACIKPYRIYRSKRTIHNFYQMLKACNYTPENIESLNSYLGLFIHYKQYRLVQKFLKKCDLSKLKKISDLVRYYMGE